MTALVTGVAGFIGSSIARRLLRQGETVLGIDCFTPYYSRRLKSANLRSLDHPGFTFLPIDLTGIEADELADVEFIFHQAGQPGVRNSWGHGFESYLRNNVMATQRLLETARQLSSLKKFVYASSSSIYGNAETFPTTEAELPRPVSPYGVTKLAGEHLVSLYGRSFGIPSVSLRYFTVYGPGQRPDMAFTRFLTAAQKGEPITIYGAGRQIRDFTFIDDVVDANLLAAASTWTCPGDVINIAGGSSISVNEVLDLIGDITGQTLDVRRVGSATGDVLRTGGSTQRATEVLGWRSSVTIRDGLLQQLEWVRSSAPAWAGGLAGVS